MKGLLLKDLYNMGQQKKMFIFLAVFYSVFALFFKEGSFMITVIVVMCAMLSITSFSYDEFSKWDSYALSLPIARKDIVAARYVFSAMMVGSGVLVAAALGALTFLVNPQTDVAALVESIVATAAVALLLLSLVLPLCYKFGLEKGRIMMMIVVMGFVFLGMSAPSILSFLVGNLSVQSVTLPSIVIPSVLMLACAVMFVFSFMISVRIYEKKDF